MPKNKQLTSFHNLLHKLIVVLTNKGHRLPSISEQKSLQRVLNRNKILANTPFPDSIPTYAGQTPLFAVIKELCIYVILQDGSISVPFAEILLTAGAEIDKPNPAGKFADKTPLAWACTNPELYNKAIKFLVAHGANVNQLAYNLPLSLENGDLFTYLQVAPLHLAINSKSSHLPEIIKLFSAKGLNPNVLSILKTNIGQDRISMLALASVYGLSEAVKELIKSGANVNQALPNIGDITNALISAISGYNAAQKNDYQKTILQLLLIANASTAVMHNNSALHESARNQNPWVIQQIIPHMKTQHENIDQTIQEEITIGEKAEQIEVTSLMVAVIHENLSAVQNLLEAGACPYGTTSDTDFNALLLACVKRNIPIIRKLLVALRDSDQITEKQKKRAFQMAAVHASTEYDPEILDELIEYGLDIDEPINTLTIPEVSGERLLIIAANYPKTFSLLLDKGAEIKFYTTLGLFFPIAVFTAVGCPDTIDAFLTKRSLSLDIVIQPYCLASMTVPEYKQQYQGLTVSPLLVIIPERTRLKILNILFEHGLNPNIILHTHNNKITLLKAAILLRDFQMIQMLLEKGADPTISTDTTSPISLACNLGLTRVVSLLLKHGAQLTSETWQIAIKKSRENPRIMQILLRHQFPDKDTDDPEVCKFLSQYKSRKLPETHSDFFQPNNRAYFFATAFDQEKEKLVPQILTTHTHHALFQINYIEHFLAELQKKTPQQQKFIYDNLIYHLKRLCVILQLSPHNQHLRRIHPIRNILEHNIIYVNPEMITWLANILSQQIPVLFDAQPTVDLDAQLQAWLNEFNIEFNKNMLQPDPLARLLELLLKLQQYRTPIMDYHDILYNLDSFNVTKFVLSQIGELYQNNRKYFSKKLPVDINKFLEKCHKEVRNLMAHELSSEQSDYITKLEADNTNQLQIYILYYDYPIDKFIETLSSQHSGTLTANPACEVSL